VVPADVRIEGGSSGSANANGFYRLFEPPGLHTLVASYFGYETSTTEVSIDLGSNTVHDVELTPLAGHSVEGTVRNGANLSALSQASVVLENSPLERTTGVSGAYEFGNIPYGVYTLTASGFGFQPERRTLTVSRLDPQLPLVQDFDLAPAALAADYEAGPLGWTRVVPPNQASAGLWVRADPVGSGGGLVQPDDDHTPSPGTMCWVTGNAASANDQVGAADIDNGATILQSPVFDLSAMSQPTISYWRHFTNDGGSNPGTDTLHVLLSNNGGTSWKVVEKVVQSQRHWVEVTVPVKPLLVPTSNMRLRVRAEDIGAGSVVEAAFDDFMVYEGGSTSSLLPPPRNVLHGATPNPFNPSTSLRFELASAGPATLAVYDARGRLVRTLWSGFLGAGPHALPWDGRDGRGARVASGVYVVKLASGEFAATRRALLLK
jgi:hypothetical protein